MLDLGPYPGVLEGGETAIRGEIYRVDAVHLARLDRFERVPELYRRISTRLQSGRVVDMYALSGPRSDEEFLRVEGGDWRAWLALRKADSS